MTTSQSPEVGDRCLATSPSSDLAGVTNPMAFVENSLSQGLAGLRISACSAWGR